MTWQQKLVMYANKVLKFIKLIFELNKQKIAFQVGNCHVLAIRRLNVSVRKTG